METATIVKEQTESQKILAQIEERIELYKKNPNVGCIFKHLHQMPSALSNIKSNVSALNGSADIPSTLELDMDLGDCEGLRRHRVIYNRGDDVFKGWEKYKNPQGEFKRPANLEPILFTGDTLLIYARTVANINLIRYLSLVEFFYPLTTGDSLVKHQELKGVGERGEDNADLVESMLILINRLSKTDEGMAFLTARAKDEKVNKNHHMVDALLAKVSGGKELVKMFKNMAIQDGIKFKVEFLPYTTERELVEAAKKINALGYNDETNAYQLKDAGEFIPNEIVFSTSKQNSPEAAEILLLDYLNKSKDAMSKLKNYVAEKSKK